jgi:putative redox protein
VITVHHEGKDRFNIDIRGHEVVVDQPPPASDDAGPTPTELFLASLAACAAFFGRRFLVRHGLPDGGLSVALDFDWGPDYKYVERIRLRVELPEPIAPELEAGLMRALERCTVDATIRAQPEIVRKIVSPAMIEEARYP